MKARVNYGEPMEEYAKKARDRYPEKTERRFAPFFGSGSRRAWMPSDLPSLAAWFRFGLALTDDGAGLCSRWADASGNARDLKATGTARPTIQADKSLLFDGVANFMKCDAFTLNQPETVYILGRQVTWVALDRLAGGNAPNTGDIQQFSASPQIWLRATNTVAQNANLAVNTYGVIAAVYNGASSLLQVNNTTATTGDVGADNMGGFTLGSIGGGASNWGNIQVKEVILYAAAHDAATRAQVINYLAALGGLSI